MMSLNSQQHGISLWLDSSYTTSCTPSQNHIMPLRLPAPSPSLLQHLRFLAFPSSSTSAPCARLSQARTLHHVKFLRRTLSTSPIRHAPPRPPSARNPNAPKSHDRGPTSEEDTQTDFGKMDIMSTSNAPQPATSIDACTGDGFHLNNGVKTSGGKGVLLVGGECFLWDPWSAVKSTKSTAATTSSSPSQSDLLDARGTLHLPELAWSLLSLLHPKPDLLLLGTGARLQMLSRPTRDYISRVLGLRVDVMDTANASAAYNLLAQERGVEGGGGVGAVMLPLGWTGAKR